jgi:hypothetical protein
VATAWSVPFGLVSGGLAGLIAYLGPALPGYSKLGWALWVAVDQGTYGAFFGFTAGLIFAAVLVAAERRRTLADIEASRFAAQGALAGAIPALAYVAPGIGRAPLLALVVFVGLSVGLGAACATLSLRIARGGAGAAGDGGLPGSAQGPNLLGGEAEPWRRWWRTPRKEAAHDAR